MSLFVAAVAVFFMLATWLAVRLDRKRVETPAELIEARREAATTARGKEA